MSSQDSKKRAFTSNGGARNSLICISKKGGRGKKKPGSCVSLLPVTRSRTRRGPEPRPCSDAARFHVSFHDKHSARRPKRLCIRPAFVWGQGGERRGDIYSRKSLFFISIFSSLPSSSGSFALAASNRAEATPNSLRSASGSESIQ